MSRGGRFGPFSRGGRPPGRFGGAGQGRRRTRRSRRTWRAGPGGAARPAAPPRWPQVPYGQPCAPLAPYVPYPPGPPPTVAATPAPPRPHASVVPLATLAAGAVGAAYLYRTDPHQGGHLLPRCPFNWLTGLLCPACGTTRLAYDLLHGDLARAVHENALVLALSPVLAWMFARWVVEGLRGRRWQPVLRARSQYSLLVVAVAWTVFRNLH